MINLSIYSNGNSTTRTVSFDFACELLAESESGSYDNEMQYFIKATTSARDASNLAYTPRIIHGLDNLALNNAKRSSNNTAVAYEDIRTMIIDYTYDYIHGHTANQFASGVKVKAPMKFS